MSAIPSHVPRLRRRDPQGRRRQRPRRARGPRVRGRRPARRRGRGPGRLVQRQLQGRPGDPAEGKVARISPLIPGIDLAGEVVASSDPSIAVGSQVLAHGYDLGVAPPRRLHRVPAGAVEWVVPLAPGLSAREAMAIGTAGFTAGMSVVALEERGLDPGRRPGPRDRRQRRRRRDGVGDPGRARLRGLGRDRQGRGARATDRRSAPPGS